MSDNWRVLWRIDTRQYDDSGKPISGSGDYNSCNCCGKDHEIWVYMEEIQTKEKAIFGTECAKKLSPHGRHLLSKNWTSTRINKGFLKKSMPQ